MAQIFFRITDWERFANDHDYSVHKMAAACAITTRHFERLFIQKFRATPREWLKDKRFSLAKDLLRAGNSIKETAFEVKFKRVPAFQKAFRNYCGVTPLEFVRGERKKRLRGLRQVPMSRLDSDLSHLDNPPVLQATKSRVKREHRN